jgi:DNA-binding XRE family transcriptional regulator
VKKPPELLKHDVILTNWRSYPEGSVERAKAIGLELLATCTNLEATEQLWEAKLDIVAKERPWKPLGLGSRDDFIKAVTGRTETAVRKKITKTQAIRERRAAHPSETQQATAKAVGCSRELVKKIEATAGTKTSESDEKVPVPAWVTRRDLGAAFRKLPADERSRLEALPASERRGSVRQAAIAAGIVKVPTALDKLRAAWSKATPEDRKTFIAEVVRGTDC